MELSKVEKRQLDLLIKHALDLNGIDYSSLGEGEYYKLDKELLAEKIKEDVTKTFLNQRKIYE